MKIEIVKYEDSGWVDIYLNGEKWYGGNDCSLDNLKKLFERLDCEVTLEVGKV